MSKGGVLQFAILVVLTACSSGPSSLSPEEEHCTLAFEGSIPEWDATTIYDVQLRNSETDPDYDDRLGTSMVFADEEGISIFTLTSFVRTTLSGEILLRKPVEGMRVKAVQSGDGVYGALVQYDGSHRFCTIPKDGTFEFDIESCASGFGPDAPITWVAPYFYIVGVNQREHMYTISQINALGTVVSIRNVLPTGGCDTSDSVELQRLGEELVVLRRCVEFRDGERCETLHAASVPTTVLGGPFVSILPEHYKSRIRLTTAAGSTSTAIRHDATCAVGGRSTCDSPSPPIDAFLLTMIDHATGTTTTAPISFIASNLIWDGENFASFGLGGDEFHITVFDSLGEPIGYARWPLGFGVEAVSGTGFAAIAPNDYVLTFHAAPLASQERLIRVKIAPK